MNSKLIAIAESILSEAKIKMPPIPHQYDVGKTFVTKSKQRLRITGTKMFAYDVPGWGPESDKWIKKELAGWIETFNDTCDSDPDSIEYYGKNRAKINSHDRREAYDEGGGSGEFCRIEEVELSDEYFLLLSVVPW